MLSPSSSYKYSDPSVGLLECDKSGTSLAVSEWNAGAFGVHFSYSSSSFLRLQASSFTPSSCISTCLLILVGNFYAAIFAKSICLTLAQQHYNTSAIYNLNPAAASESSLQGNLR